MKAVLIDLRKISDPFSGLGRFSLSLGEALYRNNQSLSLFFLVPDNVEQPWKGNAFVRIGDIPAIKRQIGLVHHLHQESDLFLPDTKNLLTVHDINFIYKYTFLRRTIKLQLFKGYLKKFDRIVCISRFTQSELVRHCAVNEADLSFIYNGLPALPAPVVPDLIPQSPFFFSVGAFLRKKNLHILLPMIQSLPDHQWILAGQDRGPYADFMKAQVQRLGLSERVIFTGPLSESHKAWYYENSLGLFFPSISEGFGLPLLEAFSAGKPVFCFPLTALPEIAGGHAFFWSDTSAEQMAKEVIRRISAESQLSRESRISHAAGFSWDKAAAEYLGVYQSMLGNPAHLNDF